MMLTQQAFFFLSPPRFCILPTRNDSNQNPPRHPLKTKNDCEKAAMEARYATSALRSGNVQKAMSHHISSAKLYRSAALRAKDADASLSRSLLLLSNTQAKSATSLRSVSKIAPSSLSTCGKQVESSSSSSLNGSNASNCPSASSSSFATATTSAPSSTSKKETAESSVPKATMSRQDRLRATVRGALDTKREADITDSTFLGTATINRPSSNPKKDTSADSTSSSTNDTASSSTTKTTTTTEQESHPIDDMMELERELRDMDMALELGNSVASLGAARAAAHNSSRTKHLEEGSFCLIPTEKSYMSTTSMWTSGVIRPLAPSPLPVAVSPVPTTIQTSKKGGKNRVQNMLEASTASHSYNHHHQQQQQPQQHLPHHPHPNNPTTMKQQNHTTNGLESSWWGNASTVSQMASSVISSSSSFASSSERMRSAANHNCQPNNNNNNHNPPTNTKQLMRLLDSLKTLGDENASLLQEVEAAQAARKEAKAAREEMKQFKADYGKRFAKMKAALEKFRIQYPEGGGQMHNPVMTSNYVKSSSAATNAASTAELQKKDEMIRKLASELRKEREESKKKDAALRKYESFYREVKARSAQKAMQRQQQQQQIQPNAHRQRGSGRIGR
mmetsp:Transcript_28115/g.37501  ORF Transcript_28115/g.37501 Transcript_28115/m.37501 type:complete len:620 (-) Transcript_28115:174-2033(-)